MSKVSVVIPTYYPARYVGEAKEDLFNQTLKVFRLYVIDYGSTDNIRKALGL